MNGMKPNGDPTFRSTESTSLASKGCLPVKRVTILDDRFDYGEPRFITLGLLSGRVVVIAHAETHEVIRIISVRKATKNEEANYFKEIAD
jgi:uncharacterized DUF497 family protein